MTPTVEIPVLKASEFQAVSVQGVLFCRPESFSLTRSLGAMAALTGLFDREPKLIAETPMPELPRLLYESATCEWRLSIAPARWDMGWTKPDSSEGTIGDCARQVYDAFERYRAGAKTEPTRCALVLTRAAPHPAPGKFLATHFCQDRWMAQPLNRPASFELHAHKQYELQGLTVNSWFRAKSGVMRQKGRTDMPVVLVEQDLNTPDGGGSLRVETVQRFFRIVPPELNQILGLYFPGTP